MELHGFLMGLECYFLWDFIGARWEIIGFCGDEGPNQQQREY